MLLRVDFEYNEPRFGNIEIEGTDINVDNEHIMEMIIDQFPEAIDIEIIKVTEIE